MTRFQFLYVVLSVFFLINGAAAVDVPLNSKDANITQNKSMLLFMPAILASKGNNETNGFDISSYANLSVGSKWYYTESNASGISNYIWEVKNAGTEDGIPVYIIEEKKNGAVVDHFFFSQDMSDGLLNTGGLDGLVSPPYDKYFWRPGLVHLLSTFEPGKQYIFQTSFSDGQSLEYSISQQKESVTVTAGTFNDCYKVTFSTDQYTWYRWYAKNVGLVKVIGFNADSDTIWDLTSFALNSDD